jgi:anti-anti-sigma factor
LPSDQDGGPAEALDRASPLIAHVEIDGAVVVRFSGELDMAGQQLAEEALDRAFATEGRGITLDLREVSFMDSTGATLLLKAAARAQEGNRSFRVLAGPQPTHVLELLGLGGLLGPE